MEPLVEKKHSEREGVTIFLLARIKEKALVASFTGKHFSGFEVHLIKVQKEGTQTINGHEIHYQEKELYRTGRDFGVSAWHYPYLELALIDHPEFKSFKLLINGKLQRLIDETMLNSDNHRGSDE